MPIGSAHFISLYWTASVVSIVPTLKADILKSRIKGIEYKKKLENSLT